MLAVDLNTLVMTLGAFLSGALVTMIFVYLKVVKSQKPALPVTNILCPKEHEILLESTLKKVQDALEGDPALLGRSLEEILGTIEKANETYRATIVQLINQARTKEIPGIAKDRQEESAPIMGTLPPKTPPI